jgi:hypothetical protein
LLAVASPMSEHHVEIGVTIHTLHNDGTIILSGSVDHQPVRVHIDELTKLSDVEANGVVRLIAIMAGLSQQMRLCEVCAERAIN